MGQRHQAFIIARIRSTGSNGKSTVRYRCVAAMHHQWCYGRLPLRAAHRFISLAKQPINSTLIQMDLLAIQDRWSPAAIPIDDNNLSLAPCAYISYLLHTAWTVDLEDPSLPYTSGTRFENDILNPNMRSGGGDNNDGITVIDITNPSSPAYCFVSTYGLDGTRGVPEWTPLTASRYCRAYYPVPDMDHIEAKAKNDPKIKDRANALEKDVQENIALLDDVPLVTVDMLAQAWPKEYAPPRAKAGDQRSQDDNSEKPTHIADLVETSIVPAIKAVVFDGEDSTALEQILEQRERLPVVKAMFSNLFMEKGVPAEGIPLLTKILAANTKLDPEATSLDLSHLQLSADQVVQLVLLLKPKVDSLNVSHNARLDILALERIIADIPSLRRLNLFNCQSIGLVELNKLLSSRPTLFMNLSYILHDLFLKLYPVVSLSPTHSFSIDSRGMYNDSLTVSLPFFTLERVVRAFADLVSPYAVARGPRQPSIDFPGKNVYAVSAALSRDDTTITVDGKEEIPKWNERNVVIIPKHARRVNAGWVLLFYSQSFFDAGDYGFVDLSDTGNSGVDAQSSQGHSEESEAQTSADADTKPDQKPPTLPRVYDLREFLSRCMEKDPGRVPAKEESVKKLEEVLTSMKERRLIRMLSDVQAAQLTNRAG